MFTCPNTACGKVFTKPLKALNLQQDTEGPYDACPYCLTEITVDDEPYINFEPETLEPETLEVETLEASVEAEPEVDEAAPVEEQAEVAEAPSECSHHLGYLSERASSDNIPDECMVCKDIVTCMLKKMKT